MQLFSELAYCYFSSVKMKLQGDKSGRKGHLSVATEVSKFISLSLFI